MAIEDQVDAVAAIVVPVVDVAALSSQDKDQAEYDAHASRLMASEDAEMPRLDGLGQVLMAEFDRAIRDRQTTEERWLKDLRQYKGQYEPEVLAELKDRSQAFVRKTRVKVKTTDSRVADMLFPAGADKHWSVEAGPKPTITEHQKAEIIKLLGDQAQAMAQAAAQEQADAAAQQQGQAPAQAARVPAAEPSQAEIEQAVIEMAKGAAKEMERTIADQLVESRYKKSCLKAIHSGHLYGTGVIKGPLVERRVRSEYIKEAGKWTRRSVEYITPFVDFVPLWRLYPDMSATELSGCSYIYELHEMTRSEFAGLAARKSFRGDLIRAHIQANPDGCRRTSRSLDSDLKALGERDTRQGDTGHTYEVIERWGYLNGEQLRNAGVDVPDERIHEAFFSNVWMLSDGEIIKASLQPIDGVTWPYHFYYFDKDETSIFGEGIASIMRDDQEMINAAIRMVLDNAGITAGPMFEVNAHLLSNPDGASTFRPWKVFLRNQTNPAVQAIRAIQVDGNLQPLINIAEKFEVQADETTAIPRYMTGENPNSGAAATMGGMSMLMGAANIVLKDLVSNWDDTTETFIDSMVAWNMQFNKDDRIKGDFHTKVTGAASLVAKEVRARQINELAEATANPVDAPYIKRGLLNKMRAEANELGNLVRTEEEVAEDPTAKMQQELAMREQQLNMAERESKILLQEAQAARFRAEALQMENRALLHRAEAVDRKLESVFVALQAAGLIVTTPATATVADEILKSANWEDDTPDPGMAELGSMPGVATAQAQMPQQMQRPGPQPVPVQPPSGNVGQRRGIETVRIEQ